MVTLNEFSRVVSAAHACAINPENWSVVMAETSRLLGATACGLVVGDGKRRSVLKATIPAEAIASYDAYYRRIDFILDACEEGPAGLIRGGQALAALRSRSEFYNDWQRPFGLTDGLFVRLPGEVQASFVVTAPARDEQFDTAERVMFVEALLPHLQQALRTRDHFAALGSSSDDITAVIDAMRHGIVVVADGCEAVHLNAAARRFLTDGDGLTLRAGRLESTRVSHNEQLQAGLARACGVGHDVPGGDSLAVSRPSGKRPYVLHILPLDTIDGLRGARALVLILDPEESPEPPKALVRRLFGLTNAEAEVALRMLRGDGIKPISEDLELSVATVKTHLHHIFEKTDTHRQAELMRLLLRVIP